MDRKTKTTKKAKKARIIDFRSAQEDKYPPIILPNPVCEDNIELTVGDIFMMVRFYEIMVRGKEESFSTNDILDEEYKILQGAKRKLVRFHRLKNYIESNLQSSDRNITKKIAILSRPNEELDKVCDENTTLDITVIDFVILVMSMADFVESSDVTRIFNDNKRLTLNLQCAFTLRKLISFSNLVTELDYSLYPFGLLLGRLYVNGLFSNETGK